MNPEITGADTRDQNPIEIVELGPDNWEVLRDLKLRTLDQEPIAMEDPEPGRKRMLERTEEEWRAIMSGEVVGKKPYAKRYNNFFAKDLVSGKYVGLVQAVVSEGQWEYTRHALVQNMFVDNEGHRGQGTGKKLLGALIDEMKARRDIKFIELNVVLTQEPAINLYKSFGFKQIRDIFKVKRGDQEYDEMEMRLELE